MSTGPFDITMTQLRGQTQTPCCAGGPEEKEPTPVAL